MIGHGIAGIVLVAPRHLQCVAMQPALILSQFRMLVPVSSKAAQRPA